MKIQIDNKYQITSDSMQYILQEKKRTKDKDGEMKEYEVNVGYYGTISMALKGYKELQIRNSDVLTVNELVKQIRELDEKIERLLGGN